MVLGSTPQSIRKTPDATVPRGQQLPSAMRQLHRGQEHLWAKHAIHVLPWEESIGAQSRHVIAKSNPQHEVGTRTLGAPACRHCRRIRMTHTRYPRAAVATGNSDQRNGNPHPRITLRPTCAPVVLWASYALPVQSGGRLVGVRRLSSLDVEVAWVAPGHTRIQWIPVHILLTETDARRWLARARFSRE